VLRWAPGSSLTPSVRDQLTAFKRNLEELFETQTRGHPGAAAGFGVPLDGPPPATQPPMAFSSELQATLAVFTSLALHQSQKRHGRGATVCLRTQQCVPICECGLWVSLEYLLRAVQSRVAPRRFHVIFRDAMHTCVHMCVPVQVGPETAPPTSRPPHGSIGWWR
jgi:hypothetical protein